jgi:Ni/Co efflux regulator RcnB
MKGKVLSIITAILFGATMVASPIVMAADTATGTEQVKPAKTKKKAAKSKKKKAPKKAKKKGGSKKKAAKQSAA